MTTELIITIIICVAAVGVSLRFYLKSCILCDEADEKLRKAKEENRRLSHRCIDLEHRAEDAVANMPDTSLGLPTFRIEKDILFYSVQAVFFTKAGTMAMTIKRFEHEYDDDSYALREAEYLLQTLNEK